MDIEQQSLKAVHFSFESFWCYCENWDNYGWERGEIENIKKYNMYMKQ